MSILASSDVSAAIDLGNSTVTLSEDDIDASVPFVADFDWSVDDDGSQIVLSSKAVIDDGNNTVDFVALIFFDAQLMDGDTNLPKEHQHVNFTNPSFPLSDNSAIWPMGSVSSKWMHIVFNSGNYSVGDYIHCHLAASGINEDPTPDATDDGECSWTVTIVP